MTSFRGYICHHGVYAFEGWRMEERPIGCPYWPLRKDDEPYERVPKRFWPSLERFMALTENEREQYAEIEGGCDYVEF